MKKAILYIAGIIGISLVAFLVVEYQEKSTVLFEKDALQFAEITKEDVVLRAQSDYIFLMEAEQQRHTYRIISEHSSWRPSVVVHNKTPLGEKSDKDLIFEAMNGNLIFEDTLSLGYKDLLRFIPEAQNFVAVEVINTSTKMDWFEKVDDSVLIFVLIGFVLSVLLCFYEGLLFLIQKVIKTGPRNSLDLVLICLVIAFFCFGLGSESYSESKVSILIQLSLILFPSYFLFKYLDREFLQDQGFMKSEFIKFLYLFIDVAIIIFLSTEIARWVDIHVFEGSTFTGLAQRMSSSLGMGFAYAFALGNFFKNIFLSLSRSLSKND